MSSQNSAKFLAIYSSLPRDEQLALVEKHLAPLLDSTMSLKAKKVLRAANRAQVRHAGMPVLDLRAKKAELSAMLEELSRDIKRAFVMEGLASKFELLNESVASLAGWLNDVWAVVYEHRVDYALAHECLLFVVQSLEEIGNIRAGCRCALTNMYIPVTLKSSSGSHIKTFNIVGAHNLQKVLEFIWRDMFLTMLASDDPRHRRLIPGMLEDIEAQINWKSVFAIFYGGKGCAHESDDDDDDEDDESDDDDDDDIFTVVEDDQDKDFVDEDSEDEDEYCDDEDEVTPRRCRHWDFRIRTQIPELRWFIQDALVAVFETRPSTALFACLIAMSPYPHNTSVRLLELLRSVATACSDTYATALEIYAFEDKTSEILELLDSHPHLLRPRDSHALQRAASLLARNGHSQRATQILETELLETARVVRQSLLLSYSLLDTAGNKSEIAHITKLPRGSAGRRERIETWVDSITTPGAEAPNPFMFAALMMGMPAMPGMHQDDDQYTYLDFDPTDPDLEDLRGEYRPALKQRFESWTDLGLLLKNGPAVLLKVYKDVVAMMPFLLATDATEEMIARLQDRTSKKHVCEGLDALLGFVKVQRRKWNIVKADLRKRKEGEGASRGHTGAGKGPASASSSKPSTSRPAPPSAPSASTSATPAQAAPPGPPAHSASDAPSLTSFTWSRLNGLAQAQAPPSSSTSAAPVLPPSPPPTFSPFGFFFGGTSNADTGFEPEAGPSSYGGGVEDVD